jgi:aconitate hydratase
MALAGSVNVDVEIDPLGNDAAGNPIYLRELWPSEGEIVQALAALDAHDYRDAYRDVTGDVPAWSALSGQVGPVFDWGTNSTYFREPPFIGRARTKPFEPAIRGRILLSFGDTVTTDHISPVGSIAPKSSAAEYLRSLGVRDRDFNTYGARRCNHDVMVRGTFANTRLRNRVLDGVEGPFARNADGDVLPVYDVAMQNIRDGYANVVVAGDQYGVGSARDWAAKGTALLGVACVVAVGFERIHRANLVGMGVLPLQVDSALPQEAIAACNSVDIEIARETRTAKVCLRNLQGAATWQGTARVLVNSNAEWAYVDAGGLLPRVFGTLSASLVTT